MADLPNCAKVIRMSTKVIDISQWQGVIDWDTVTNHIDGCIIRCGWGSDSIGQDDTQFARNISECERLGIPYGIYLYSYAQSESAAISEAQHVLRLLKGHTPALPVYFDSEENGTEYCARANAIVFCDAIRNAGYVPGVYASLSWWQSYLHDIPNVSVWCARWQSTSPGMECDIWQYTSDGSVPGISGRVDMNECYIPFIDYKEVLPMECILHPDESNHLFYVNGSDITYIPWSDSVHAIDMLAEECGKDIPHVALGTKDAPYGLRFFEACNQKALYDEIVNGIKPPQQDNAQAVADIITAIAQAMIEIAKPKEA